MPALTETTRSTLVETVLDVAIAAGAAATIATHAVLFLDLRAGALLPIAAVVAVPLIVVLFPRGHAPGRDPKAQVALGGLACLAALISLCTSRPDPDDLSYLHRALAQLGHLREPLFRTATAFDEPGLPPISAAHLSSAFEPTTVFLADALGTDPLFAAQGVAGAVALALVPLVLASTLATGGASARLAVAGAAGALVYLAASGEGHRAFGNFTLVRAWQGKCLLVVLVLPLVWRRQVEYLERGEPRDLVRLALAVVAGAGASSSALFLLPFLGATLALAFAIARRDVRVTRLAAAGAAHLYPVLVAGLVARLLPAVPEATAFREGWPAPGLASLGLVFTTPRASIVAAALVALAAREARLGPVVLAHAAIALAAATLPGPRDVLAAVVPPAAYWRFAYVLPVPLAAALATAGIVRRAATGGRERIFALVSAAAIGLALASGEFAVRPILAQRPAAPKLEPPAAAVADAIDPGASAGAVLAPEGVVAAVGLLRPELRFVSTRTAETLHAFAAVGRADEGRRRAWAAAWLGTCRREAGGGELVDGVVATNVTTVVARACGTTLDQELRARLAQRGRWSVGRTDAYVVFRRDPGAVPRRESVSSTRGAS